jgi:hypothetical protein
MLYFRYYVEKISHFVRNDNSIIGTTQQNFVLQLISKNFNFSQLINRDTNLRKLTLILVLLLFAISYSSAQDGNVEIYLIDSYVTPELPHTFVLSFYTSDSCTSKLLIDNKKEKTVSGTFEVMHKTEVDFTNIKFDSANVPFQILVTDKNGKISRSEKYTVTLPYKEDLISGNGPGFFKVFCFGGIIFGLPSPTYVSLRGEDYLAITKEIPLFSFYSGGYNYPVGYISAEYEHIFNAYKKNFIRAGYKHIFQIPGLEYISPGLSWFSDFNGYNGLSPEMSIGFMRIYNVFTLYAKYRYNFKPNESSSDFHEFSVGLYSNFFSINF